MASSSTSPSPVEPDDEVLVGGFIAWQGSVDVGVGSELRDQLELHLQPMAIVLDDREGFRAQASAAEYDPDTANNGEATAVGSA